MQQISLKKNSILNVIKTLSSVVFPLITFPYISRVLLPTNVGKVSFGSSFISYFSMIASLGITTYAIRECSAVSNDKEKLSKKSSEIFSINVCTTIVAYILLAISLFIFRKLDAYRTLIIIQSTSILFVTLGADWLNTAMEDFKYITIRTVVFQILSLILMFVFVREEGDYLKYAAISVFAACGANLVNIYYRKKFCKVSFTFDMQWKQHFKPIILLFVMILAQTVFSSADVTMLGIMRSDYEVGIYSTAHKIENIISQVVSSLAWVVMPRMSAYYAVKDYEKINNLLCKTFELLMFIGIPAVAGACVLSEEIVMIAGGSDYIESSLPLTILMFSFAFSLIGGSFLGNMVLLPSGKEKTYMFICCITAVANVFLNYLLIPRGGACAAAFTTSVSSFLIMIMLLIKKDKNIHLDYLKRAMMSPLIGAMVICVYCEIVKLFISDLLLRTLICISGSLVIYVVLMILLKNEFCLQIVDTVKERLRKWGIKTSK